MNDIDLTNAKFDLSDLDLESAKLIGVNDLGGPIIQLLGTTPETEPESTIDVESAIREQSIFTARTSLIQAVEDFEIEQKLLPSDPTPEQLQKIDFTKQAVLDAKARLEALEAAPPLTAERVQEVLDEISS